MITYEMTLMSERIRQTSKDMNNLKSPVYKELEEKKWPAPPVDSRAESRRDDYRELDDDMYFASLPSRPHLGSVVATPAAIVTGAMAAMAGGQVFGLAGAIVGGIAGFGFTQLVFS